MTGINRIAVLLIFFFFLNLTLVFSSIAGEVLQQLLPDQSLLDDPHMSILVVTVDKPLMQNLDSAKGGFFVDEVLRGNVKDNYIYLKWQIPKPKGLQEGDKLIVIAYVIPKTKKETFKETEAEVAGVYKYSNANRETVLKNMAPPERKASIQLPLLLMIFIIPIFLKLQKRHHNVSIVLILLQFVAYFIYESGISKYSNIRVDLLLVYPALISSFVIFLTKRKPTQ